MELLRSHRFIQYLIVYIIGYSYFGCLSLVSIDFSVEAWLFVRTWFHVELRIILWCLQLKSPLFFSEVAKNFFYPHFALIVKELTMSCRITNYFVVCVLDRPFPDCLAHFRSASFIKDLLFVMDFPMLCWTSHANFRQANRLSQTMIYLNDPQAGSLNHFTIESPSLVDDAFNRK